MPGLFYPSGYAKSVFDIDYGKLYEAGFRGLVFDIDQTLVPHGGDSTPEIDALFQRLRAMGFGTLILSNHNEARVKRFLKNIDALYICDAGKPRPRNYRRDAELLGVPVEKAVCIGDQLFTDMLGANLSGMASILVDFIREEGETDIGKKRRLENLVLFFYKRSKKYRRGAGIKGR